MIRKRATLKDVAAEAGVHVSTVSRALDARTRHLITAETVEQVLQVSRRLGYRQNAAAYSLKTNRTRTVGVVLPDITNPIFPPIIRGVEDALARHGYVAIIANTDSDLLREESITDTLRMRGVDGLVLASVQREDETVTRLIEEALPIVTVNRHLESGTVSSVAHDEEAGIRLVLEHLLGLGHRRIANIAGPQNLSTGAGRLDAFVRHRAALGLVADPRLVVLADAFREDEGERCTAQLLALGGDFTALVCSNDRLAVGAIGALRRAGLRCPEDISVTGYNDMPLMDRLMPPLTTIRVQQYQAGFAAAELLWEAIQTPPAERKPRQVVLPVELIVRDSTRALSALESAVPAGRTAERPAAVRRRRSALA